MIGIEGIEQRLDETFSDTALSRVITASGYGIKLYVSRGHLIVEDGIGKRRRTRLVPRAQRTVRRLLILGHTGNITLDAIRWCTDIGITIVHIDSDGRVLMVTNGQSHTDSRLIRAQAAAAANDVGVTIAKQLLSLKLAGHAAIAEHTLHQPGISAAIRRANTALDDTVTLTAARAIEAQAANIYFSAWAGHVHARFATRDQRRVPDRWRMFAVRTSPLHTSGHSPRSAADPVNALLNYGYALAEVECRIACLALGLDPGLGIIHTDKKNRDSLALDLLEVLRPVVERHMLNLLQTRTFRAEDFTETRDGRCRLMPPLTHQLTEQLLPALTKAVAGPAERTAHTLARSSPGKVQLRTPLSRANGIHAQRPNAEGRPPKGAATASSRLTCQQCGADLYGSARKLCPTCWPVMRNEYMRQLGKARAKPSHPAKATTEELSGGWTHQQYQCDIMPKLAHVSLLDIERSTGLSNASCSRVRAGTQIPNPKHWSSLSALTGRDDGTPQP